MIYDAAEGQARVLGGGVIKAATRVVPAKSDRSRLKQMTVQYDLEGQQRVYEKWAPIYDAVYHQFLTDAHSKTSAAAAACGRTSWRSASGRG